MEWLAAWLQGVAAGALGVLPFVHPNALLRLNAFQGIDAAVFAAALAFSHIAFQTIPTVFLCLPSSGQSVGVLPAQRMALEGRTGKAFSLVLKTSFWALAFALALTPFSIIALKALIVVVKPFAGAVLALLAASFVVREKNVARAGLAFAVAGAVGFAALVLPVAREPLFPLLTGLFGVPALLASFNAGKAAEVTREPARVNRKIVFASVAVASLSPLLPALTPALLASLAFLAFKPSEEEFLTASTALVVSKTFFDFAATHAIGKARSGTAALALEALKTVSAQDVLLFAVVAATALAFATLALLFAQKWLNRVFYSINQKALATALFAGLTAAVFLASGAGGLVVLATASAAGAFTDFLGARKGLLSGALIAPSLAHSFGVTTAIAAALL